jgi:hypothetical protein
MHYSILASGEECGYFSLVETVRIRLFPGLVFKNAGGVENGYFHARTGSQVRILPSVKADVAQW